MYARTVTTKTKQGPVEYLQLCHNEHDPVKKRSKTHVIYNFGRLDQVDHEGVRRLIRSLSRFLPDGAADLHQFTHTHNGHELEFLGSRQLGGTWLLDGMWKRLGIQKTITSLVKDRGFKNPIERMLFALTANRALAPSSKLSLEHWVAHEAHIPGLEQVDVHQLYRAMDVLMESSEAIQRRVFQQAANLFNLEVDLIFIDTTTTYFEMEGEDEDFVVLDENDQDYEVQGYRKRSKYGKDNHPELAQVVMCFAVTREGIPVRCWSWPGTTSDQAIVQEIKEDLNQWELGRTIYVEDTGFNSAKNRRIFQGAGDHYIIGEKLRVGSKGEAQAALRQKGKFKKLSEHLEIKEVILDPESTRRRRFVVVRNMSEAKRDAAKRSDIIYEVERRLAELSQEKGELHTKKACALRSHQVFGRYIRQTKTGKLLLDQHKIKREALFDGKYLISTSDEKLSAEDVVLGYKQLASVERVFRDMKHLIDIRPVYHRREDRIKSHVLLCWLAMLLIRIAENETGKTWFQMKKLFAQIQLGSFKIPEGTVHQSTQLTPQGKGLFNALQIDAPPRFFRIKA